MFNVREETPSNPFHEEIDATGVAGNLDASELGSTLNGKNNGADDFFEELSADESLEMTLSDTQDVSAWLEESLFIRPRVEQVTAAKAAKIEVKNKVSPVKGTRAQKVEFSSFFNDFENNAPEPPPSLEKVETHEPHLTCRTSAVGRREARGLAQKWCNEILHSGKRPLLGSSLIAVLAVCGAVAYSVIQQEKNIASIEPQALSLIEVAPISAEQEKPVREPSEERYCLAQGIRLGAAVERVALSGVPALGLEVLFAEFSLRCERYQYVPETYLIANLVTNVVPLRQVSPESEKTAVIEPEIASLNNLQLSDASSILVPADDVNQGVHAKQVDLPRSTQVTKNIQWRLMKLGFYQERLDGKGRIDGTYNESTQAAVKAFYTQHAEFAESQVEAEIFSAIDSVYALAK